ncbi:hypothetical protein JCM21900_003140 [Sporobolomyces salmonicolor]
MAENASPPAPKKAEQGLWDSLSPEDQKKYALVFLISVGTTLLVTGRSGGSLLKRAKNAEASAPPPPSAAPRAPRVRTRAPALSTPVVPPPRPSAAAAPAPPTSSLPSPPPPSIVHPNSLTPPKPRRLLPLFVAPSSHPSALSSRPAPSAYFLPNSHLADLSSAYATELDRLDKLHEDGRVDEEKPAPDDGFNPAVFAAKALGIATAMTFGTFAVGIWSIMKWLGADDMESLSLELSHRLSPFLDSHRPAVPAWAQPSESVPSTRDSTDDHPTNREELSYWAQIKQALDEEAEERTRERRSAWERMRTRAAELGAKSDETREV